MRNLVILISGTGTNMLAVINACKSGAINARVRAVISSNENAKGLIKATNEGIKTFACPLSAYSSGLKRDEAIKQIAKECDADYIVLAGYLGIVSDVLIKAYPQRIINIHPSLLPKFGGKGCFGIHVHKQVILAGEKVSGASVHFVDEDIDTGAIIAQRSLDVLEDDTAESLQQRILTQIEPFLLCDVLADLCKE